MSTIRYHCKKNKQKLCFLNGTKAQCLYKTAAINTILEKFFPLEFNKEQSIVSVVF